MGCPPVVAMPTPLPLLTRPWAASAAEVEWVANLEAVASLEGCDQALADEEEAEGRLGDEEEEAFG